MENAGFWGRRVVRHGIGWVLVMGFFSLLTRQVGPGKVSMFGLPYSVLLMVVLAAAIYAHYWLLTHLLERRRYGWYIVATLAVVLAGTAVLSQLNPAPRMNPIRVDIDGNRAPGPFQGWAESGANVVFALVLATIARYVRRGIVSRRQVQLLRALQLETELSLLKAQVNQHFLFNTLNNLYGLSLAAPDQMPEALLQLAGLMRYQLDSSRQAAVTVGTEAEYLGNYIGLEKLRLRPNTQVEFRADLSHPDRPLAPLLLLPLVENCFKHAIDPSADNFIRIHLTQTDTGLTLRTTNSIPAQFRPAPSGLGLPTLRARLAQLYPGSRHRLTVEATMTTYAATLHLVL